MGVGIACLAVVVLDNVAELFDVFPTMSWDRSDGPGRYLNLTCSLVGVAAITTWLVSQRPRSLDGIAGDTVQFSVAGAPNCSVTFPTKILVLRNQLFNQISSVSIPFSFALKSYGTIIRCPYCEQCKLVLRLAGSAINR
jgi:hypothetical protein